MKGPKLIINILISIAISCIFLMVCLNLYPSWSEYARSYEEQLLFLTLGSIYGMYLLRSQTFENRERILFYKPVKANVRQVNIWTAFMFFGILATPVTIGNPITEILHYVFTISAILFAYAGILNYYVGTRSRTISKISLLFPLLGMVGGKFFGLWTVGVGELIAAFPVVIHILITNNFREKRYDLV